MWSGDWSKFPEETLRLLKKNDQSSSFLQEAKSLLYTLGNRETPQNDYSRMSRVICLGPYLFGIPYYKETSEGWAKESGIFFRKSECLVTSMDAKEREIVLILDTFTYHLSLFLTCLRRNRDFVSGRLSLSCEIIIDNFDDKIYFYEAADSIKNSELYTMFKKTVKPQHLNDNQVLGCFLLALKICLGYYKHCIEESLEEFVASYGEKPAVEKLKNDGNSEFFNKSYTKAKRCYSEAIEMSRFNYILYGNRAQCYLQLNHYEDAEIDARRAIILHPDWEKGYYRLGQAFEGQKKLHHGHLVLEYYLKRQSTGNLNTEVTAVQQLHQKLFQNCNLYDCPQKRKLIKKKNDGLSKKENNKSISDLPDLVSDSDSEKGDDTKNNKSKESSDTGSNNKSTKAPGDSKKQSKVHFDQSHLKQGTEDLLKGLYRTAVQNYKKALSVISNLPAKQRLPEIDVVCIKYALAYSCVKINSLEELKEGIKVYQEIINDHKEVVFPLCYYGIGEAYKRMNRFQDALQYLSKGLEIIKKGINFEKVLWPGSRVVIEESDRNVLQDVIDQSILICKNPPSPDAKCCSSNCSLHRYIYYTDPDFRGFQQLHCKSKCVLQYHPVCWKEHKDKLEYTDKSFLGSVCPTPDCGEPIVKIEAIEKDGTVGKQFIHPDFEKDNIPKQKKTKKEKRQELREQKKRKRVNSLSSAPKKQGSQEKDEDDESSSRNADTGTSTSPTQDDIPAEVKKVTEVPKPNNSEEEKPLPKITEPPTQDDACYILKRDTEEEGQNDKHKKSKDKKKRHKSFQRVDIMTDSNMYNQFEERIKKLKEYKTAVEEHCTWNLFCESQKNRLPQLDPERPFYIPEDLRRNESALEEVLQYCRTIRNTEEVKAVKEHVFEYLYDYVCNNGPISKDDPQLKAEIDQFPTTAKQLIAEAGGITNFLLQSLKFYIYENTIYAKGKRKHLDSLDGFEDISNLYCEDNGGSGNSASYIQSIDFHSLVPKEFRVPTELEEAFVSSVEASSNEYGDRFNSLPSSLSSVDAFVSQALSTSTDVVLYDLTMDKNKSKQSKTLIKSCLKTLLPRHLAEITVLALNTFEQAIPDDIFQKMNSKLKSVHLVYVDRLQDASVQCGEEELIYRNDDNEATLYDDYCSLKRELNILKSKLDNTLDSNTQLRKKLELEKQLSQSKADDYLEEKQTWERIKQNLEAEKKRLQQENAKLKDELKRPPQIPQDTVSQYEKEIQELKEKLSDATLEIARKSEELNQLQENFNAFTEVTDKSVERARTFEARYVEITKEMILKSFDHSYIEADKLKSYAEQLLYLFSSVSIFATTISKNVSALKKYLTDVTQKIAIFKENIRQYMMKLEQNHVEILPPIDLPELPFEHFQDLLNDVLTASCTISVSFASYGYSQLSPHGNSGMITNFVPSYDVAALQQSYSTPDMLLVAQDTSRTTAPGLPLMNIPSSSISGDASMFDSSSFVSKGDFFPLSSAENKSSASFISGLSGLSKSNSSKVHTASSSAMQQSSSSIAPPSASARPPPGLKPFSLPSTSNRRDAAKPSTSRMALDSFDDDLKVDTNVSETASLSSVSSPKSSRTITPTAEIGAACFTSSIPAAPSTATKATKPTDKLLLKLETKYPHMTRKELASYLKRYRSEKMGLSGIKIDEIVKGVSQLIDKDIAVGKLEAYSRSASKVEVDQLDNFDIPRHAWGHIGSGNGAWSGDPTQCSICLEDLKPTASYKPVCGHSFHVECIKQWLQRESTCPNCRVHLLLDEEYPAL